MIGHQAVGITGPVEAFAGPVQGGQEAGASFIGIAGKDRTVLVTTHGKVV